MSLEHPFAPPQLDLKVLRVCIETDTFVTPPVIDAVWAWFSDVEIVLPIPDMELKPEDRKRLSLDIIDEMIEEFKKAGEKWTAATEGLEYDEEEWDEDYPVPSEVAEEEVQNVDTLWRELSGCLAATLNDMVPQFTEEAAEYFYAHILEQAADDFQVSLDEVREALKTDVSFRMMLRRQGFDPDRIR